MNPNIPQQKISSGIVIQWSIQLDQILLLLLLLTHFNRVRLCATTQTAVHQAPPSLRFSRQEHWSGLPFPSPMRDSEVAQLSLTLSNPMDCSLPGSSIQGRVLQWGAIAFSEIKSYKSKRMCKLQPNPTTWMSLTNVKLARKRQTQKNTVI